MERYKKYRTIQKASYIVFFLYLLILALSNFSFNGNVEYIPYFIIIPFVVYCVIMITTEILIYKEREAFFDTKQSQLSETNFRNDRIEHLLYRKYRYKRKRRFLRNLLFFNLSSFVINSKFCYSWRVLRFCY